MRNHLLLAMVILFSNAIAFARCELSPEGEKIFKIVKLTICYEDPTHYCVHALTHDGSENIDPQILVDCDQHGRCNNRGQVFASRTHVHCFDDIDDMGRPKRVCDGSRDFFEILSLDRQTEYAECDF